MFWMLNGTSPAGREGSTKAFAPRSTWANEPSKTSMRAWASLAAYKKLPELLLPMARPVKTAPETVASTWAVMPALLFQAEMVPLRSAKMKEAGLVPTRNDVVLFWTWPVGPWGPVGVVGMATTSAA